MKNPLEKKPFIIADVGSNWKRFDRDDYNLELAFRHIDDARRCGCDAVKFQFFTYRELYGVDGPDPFALPLEWIPKLASRASVAGIEFMCTAFSPEGAKLIDPYVRVHKVASSELQYWELIETLRATGKPIIFSTGGASLEEVAILFERLAPGDAVLETVANYPAASTEYDFTVLRESKCLTIRWYGGVSDHTQDEVLAVTAAGAGATIFEKHFDALGDFDLSPLPDSPVSLSPTQLTAYCKLVRVAVELATQPSQRTEDNAQILAREKWKRRLKVTKELKRGDVLEYGVNFGLFRSEKTDLQAAPPKHLLAFMGKQVKREKKPQDGLWFDDID